jgi:hypothetical protein
MLLLYQRIKLTNAVTVLLELLANTAYDSSRHWYWS